MCVRFWDENLVSGPDVYNFLARTPKYYHHDRTTHTQVLEWVSQGINLKAYALKYFLLTLPTCITQCTQLGGTLSKYAQEFHKLSEVFEPLRDNCDMQKLKQMINYDWLVERIAMFPEILEEAREDFVKVKEMATVELTTEKLVSIHGDFWTGK